MSQSVTAADDKRMCQKHWIMRSSKLSRRVCRTASCLAAIGHVPFRPFKVANVWSAGMLRHMNGALDLLKQRPGHVASYIDAIQVLCFRKLRNVIAKVFRAEVVFQ